MLRRRASRTLRSTQLAANCNQMFKNYSTLHSYSDAQVKGVGDVNMTKLHTATRCLKSFEVVIASAAALNRAMGTRFKRTPGC
jgi:hypothetical protein